MNIKANNRLRNALFNHPSINNSTTWFVGVGLGLTFLHLVLTWRLMPQSDQLMINALFWLAMLGTLAKQPHPGRRDRLPRAMGLMLLGLIIAKSLSMAHLEAWFVRLFPAIAVIALALLISGFHLKPHWRAGLLLMPLLIPRSLVEGMTEWLIGQPLQIVTAQFAAFMLHYLGFDAVQQRTTITLNQGAVDVLFRCTGIPLLILLLQLALLFFMMFPLCQKQRMRLLIIAVLIAFLLSTVRVALMAVVVNDPIAFNYWHGGNGSQLFSTGAIALFGWLCQQALPCVQID